MTDITTIPMEELLNDRAESLIEIKSWTKLFLGHETSESKARVWANKQIVAKIDAEIARRKE